MKGHRYSIGLILTAMLLLRLTTPVFAEDWMQFKFDSRKSGNAAGRELPADLGLLATVPLSDAIFTAPVIADGQIYVVDGSGKAVCIDAKSFEIVWQFQSRGGPTNCNNVSSPAVVGDYLHFGTVAGNYYVLDRKTGKLVKELACGGPIFSSVVTNGSRAYFATVGARVFAVDPRGQVAWTWDFVREVLKFNGDRWSGEDWRKHKDGRVDWRDHFCCSRNLAVMGQRVVIPAGGRTVFLTDQGNTARLDTVAEIPSFAGKEYAAAFGQSIGEAGEVYVQWHRRDNAGRVEVLKLGDDGKVTTSFVPGTQTAINLRGLLSFASVSIRGKHIYRCRPEQGFEFCRHAADMPEPVSLGGYPGVCPPILTRNHAIYGGLDGKLHLVPLSGQSPAQSVSTAFGAAITAPAAVCDARVYFTCEDGYLYVLGDKGQASLPTQRLPLHLVRSPLTGKFADSKYNWFTNYGDQQNTNANEQGIVPPLKIKWIRRYQGTFKHIPVCGGGRMYTHTAEGQVFAVEQETGRQLWRKYWPGVYLSFTSPIYFTQDGQERLLIPQAGMTQSRLRCLDAATGDLLWETPFTGSPSWSRQAPPIVHDGLAIYASGSGDYDAQGTDKAFIMKGKPRQQAAEIMSWIYTHNNPYYPKNNRPLIWAWDLKTGDLVWKRDFSSLGRGGNDCGLCLMDGKLYYSTFFGYSAVQRKRRGLPDGPNGLTACLTPRTGKTVWMTTKHHVTAGCTISAKAGRVYLGGYNQPDESTKDRYVFCLDAKDGSLKWKSDPVRSAVNVITVGDDFIFSNASGRDGHVFELSTGKIVSRFNKGYACTRFTCTGTFVMGANMDMIDLSQDGRLVSTGPCIDSRECVGSSVSNGRVFYTSQASGLQVSLSGGAEATRTRYPWQR